MSDIALPQFPRFDLENISTLGTKWERYVDQFKNFLVAVNVTDNDRKKALLLHYAGEEIYDIYQTLPDLPEAEKKDADDNDLNEFELQLAKLNKYFKKHVNEDYEIFVFSERKQKETETIDQYYAVLRDLAKTCNFDNKDKAIKAQLVRGSRYTEVRTKVLGPNKLDLNALLEHARALEVSTYQIKQIEKPSPKEETSNKQEVQAVKNNCYRHKFKQQMQKLWWSVSP